MIEIRHLCKRYGAVEAVRDLTLQVPAGELFCFLGPNGAGKTTTIKMLTGLVKPTSGSVALNGIDVQADPVAAKRLVGYIPDMPYLYDRLTATEFFRFTGELYDVPRAAIAARLDESFALFGLDDCRAVLTKDLSHGMRQRLIYACTLLHEPRILFIDEPLIGLDPHTIRLIKDLLVARARAGVTVFLTTHILALAEDIADRVGIIAGGRLLDVCRTAELLAKAGAGTLEAAFLRLTERQGIPYP